MSTKNGHQRQYEETFKRKLAGRGQPVMSLRAMAQLRAENEALRHQITSLQSQWDVLKSTLGVLSTTLCSPESY